VILLPDRLLLLNDHNIFAVFKFFEGALPEFLLMSMSYEHQI